MASAVTIIGGHGKIALRLAKLLHLAHKVHSVIRLQEHVKDIEAVNATPVLLSLEDEPSSKFTELFEQTNTGVVVFSAGAGGKGGPERTKKVDYEGALKIFDAIEAVKGEKPRLILVSAIDSRDENIIPEHYTQEDLDTSKKMREALKVYAHWKYEADKELQKRTAFKWTQVFPGHLLDDPGVGTATIGKSRLVNNQIRRDDVASVLALLVERPDAAGLGLNIVNGDTPIAEALDTAIKNRVTAWIG